MSAQPDDAYDAGYRDRLQITVSREAAGVNHRIHARSRWVDLPDFADMTDRQLVDQVWQLVTDTDPGNPS